MLTVNLRSLPESDPGPWIEIPFQEGETDWSHLPLISKRQLEAVARKLRKLVMGRWELVGCTGGKLVAQMLQDSAARSGALRAEVVRGRWLKVDPGTGAWEVWHSGFYQRGHIEFPEMERLVVVPRVRRFQFVDSGDEFYADGTKGTSIVMVAGGVAVEVYTQAVTLPAATAALGLARAALEPAQPITPDLSHLPEANHE